MHAPPTTNSDRNTMVLEAAKAKETTIMISPTIIVVLCDLLLIFFIDIF